MLHPKVQEAKRKAAPLNKRALSVNEMGELVERDANLDKRVVEGYAVIWGQRNLYGEKFTRGCFAKSIRERGPGANAAYEIKFLNQHNPNDPLSLFEVLIEDEIGLYFRTVPLDDVTSADRVLKQLKSRTLNNFSLGFGYMWDKVEWEDETNSLIILECNLFEISVVTIPADMETYAIRSAEAIESLDDDIEYFINILPRKHQMEARALFSRQKSLIDIEQPLEQRKIALPDNEPVKGRIDYSLFKDLKIF